jgi:hypothetical protein
MPTWLDTAASDPFYRKSDALPPSFNPIAHFPLNVLLPNSSTLSSSATSSTTIGTHTFDVHLFDDDKLHHSLQSVATFTNDMGGSVLFTAAGATIYDRDSNVINFSPKALDDRIWTFAPSSASHCNNVIRHDLYASFTEYAHATLGSPSGRIPRCEKPLKRVISEASRGSLCQCGTRTLLTVRQLQKAISISIDQTNDLRRPLQPSLTIPTTPLTLTSPTM